jgi:methyl coenzyme M reductase alpha subunit
LGNFSLIWTAPVTRADGTPLSLADIDGFRILYGTESGNYPNIVDINDGTAQSATVNNITTGTYYAVMTTYDTSGLESGYSAEIVKVAR